MAARTASPMSTRMRPSRRSEPARPSTSATVPKQRGGWEYPLSREEKKQRVLYLFQAELQQAEQSSAENVEALQALLEKRSAPPSVSDLGGACTAPAPAPGRKAWRRRLESISLGLLGGLGVLVIAWLLSSTVQPDHASAALTLDPNDTVVPPNITDRVMGMRNEGHLRLQLSNCPEAEWWFSLAIKTLTAESNVSDVYRNHIVGERGFALVCSQRYKEGAKQLEQHLAHIGFAQGAAHLLNALGYAYFQLEDFHKAAEFFQFSLRADKFNPVPWNNYAAALMVAGDVRAADEALLQAAENVKRLFVHQDHHTHLITHNGHLLIERAQGRSEHLPWAEIWNGYID